MRATIDEQWTIKSYRAFSTRHTSFWGKVPSATGYRRVTLHSTTSKKENITKSQHFLNNRILQENQKQMKALVNLCTLSQVRAGKTFLIKCIYLRALKLHHTFFNLFNISGVEFSGSKTFCVVNWAVTLKKCSKKCDARTKFLFSYWVYQCLRVLLTPKSWQWTNDKLLLKQSLCYCAVQRKLERNPPNFIFYFRQKFTEVAQVKNQFSTTHSQWIAVQLNCIHAS